MLGDHYEPQILDPSLTPAQREAILHVGGPLLIVAGPGAGKTDVMVRRAAYLIRERGIHPEHLLVTTFTNKAADELYDRLYHFLGERAHVVHISTIHSFCRTLLERYPTAHPWRAWFQVLDARAQFLFVYARLSSLGLSKFPKGRRMGEFVADVVATFNLLTEELVAPERFVEQATTRAAELLGLKKAKPESLEEYIAVAEAYGRYIELLREENVIDFGMLQQAAYRMVTENEPLRDEIANRYRHIMVDEYQDTNRLQVLLIKEIARPENEICAVGDDDQAIYRFRGATDKSFRHFEADFGSARRIDLDVNFRSTPVLVETASALIAHNAPRRTEKQLSAHRTEAGAKPILIHGETAADEAEVVARALARWKERGLIESYDDVAVLFRSVKYHAGEYLAAFDRHEIPYTVVADGGFFDREDVIQLKDLFTFCGWKHKWDPRFLRGKLLELSPETIEAVALLHRDPREWENEETLESLAVKDPTQREVLRQLGELRRKTLDGDLDKNLVRLFYELLRASGYIERCCARGPCGEGDREAESALLNLGQFSTLVADFQHHVRSISTYRLGQYLRSLPARSLDALRPEPEKEAIRVMTVHQAKGLEFPVVVLGAAMEGRFPGRFRPPAYPVPQEIRVSGEIDDAVEHERDQRRLFYVAMTRAEDLLVLGTADKVTKRGSGPSHFLEEIGRERLITPDLLSARVARRDRKAKAPVRERVSYSALHSYLLCPLQYQLLYVSGFRPPQFRWFYFGHAVHKALERLHRRALEGETVDHTVAEAMWSELWNPPQSWTKRRAAQMGDTGLKYLRRYVEHYGDRFNRVRWVEEPLELPVSVDERDGILVTGRLDLACEAERGVEVIDFKVRSRTGLDIIRPDYQVRTYAVAVEKTGGQAVDRVLLHLLAEEPGQDLVTYEWSNVVAREAEEMLRIAADGILSRRFEPTPGLHCEFCDFRRLCPVSMARDDRSEEEEESPHAVPVGVTP